MKPEITNKVTRLDIDKITNMVMHEYNKTPLINGVYKTDSGYQIDGIAHLSEDLINDICDSVYIKAAKETIYSALLIDDVKEEPVKKVRIASIEELDDSPDPVFDITMQGDNHYFFGNEILVHNTDSVYFSSKKSFIEQKIDFDWNDRDQIIELYKAIGSEVGKSFPQFMIDAFNPSPENAKIIDADLEMIGSRGLFLKKKRYGILKYWDDGFRVDVKGKPGKLKAMGVEIKRSDTPKHIQKFLEELFIDLLSGANEADLRKKVIDFKFASTNATPWSKGTPKTVKKLTVKTKEYDNTGKCAGGHVRAAINWNKLRNIHKDLDTTEISDGGKVIVCKLRSNIYSYTSIAVPIEALNNLPTWFTDLPFSIDVMDTAILTKKLDNIFGVLNLDIGININQNTTSCNPDLFGWD